MDVLQYDSKSWFGNKSVCGHDKKFENKNLDSYTRTNIK